MSRIGTYDDKHGFVPFDDANTSNALDALDCVEERKKGEWDMFDLISSAWYGKGMYFKQDNGTVYSRHSGEYMTVDEAIREFISLIDIDELTDTNVGKWIPVAERLPKSGVHVLACCRVKWLGGGGRSYVCDAFYSAPKTEVCSYNDDIDSEYDEETDEYYMPEGWWEVIKNWDDFSCVAIGDFVTHWMPLPDPPKEET